LRTAGEFQLLEESPEDQKQRQASFLLACVAEVLAAGLLTVVCASLPKSLTGRINRYVVLTFPAAAERHSVPKSPVLPKRSFAPYVVPTPRVALPRITESEVRVVTRVPTNNEPPLTSAVAIAPARRVPTPPPSIRTGVFGQAPETHVAENTPLRQVQTGGFGSPEGVAGQAQGGNPGNVPKLGSFDLPGGPGTGNGTGGAEGKRQVVADAGFGTRRDVTTIKKIDESDTPRWPATSGFGSGGLDTRANGVSRGGAPAVVRTGAFAPPLPAQTPATQPLATTPEIRPVEILSKPSPQYTEEARRLGVQGEVVLSVIFQADGTLKVVGIIKSLGHGLDQKAEQAATQIRFKPAEQAGRPTSFPATLHIEFRLA
jgi:TonB family protein